MYSSNQYALFSGLGSGRPEGGRSDSPSRGVGARGDYVPVIYFILLFSGSLIAKPCYLQVLGFVSSIWTYRLFKSLAGLTGGHVSLLDL